MEYEYEDMEFEYTNPQPLLNPRYNAGSFALPPKGTFSIPSSFFEGEYKKSSFMANNVCSLLDKFSLDEQDSCKDPLFNSNEKSSISIDSPPISPSQDRENKPDANTAVIVRGESEPVLPEASVSHVSLSPICLSEPTENLEVEPLQKGSQQKKTQSQLYPSHTFIYQAAPNASVSHVDYSHGAIYYITGIVKLIFRTVFLAGLLYIGSQLVRNFHHDMNNKIAEYESDLLSDQIYCQQQYGSNRCTPDTRLPAVEELCRSWERCMLRPIAVSKTKVLAEVFAEVFNGFVNTLSIRTLVYTSVIGLGFAWSITSLFSQTKNKSTVKTPVEEKCNNRLLN